MKEIEIKKITPHPDNPRGARLDVTDLKESIAERGILQPLTVMEQDGGFVLLIGHRRLEAAKQCGMETVPCVILEPMPKEDQMSIMLSENMQRNDLTPLQEAEGFQYMMDLGVSVSEAAKKTGFSESTIRRRTKLLELDRGGVEAAQEKGATLADFAELEKIKDVSRRNKVLEKIGTEEFQLALSREKRRENIKKNKAEAIRQLEHFADEISNTRGFQYFSYINLGDNKVKINIPNDIDDTVYGYQVESSYISLYRKKDAEDEEKVSKIEVSAEETERLERLRKLNELNDEFADLRKTFMKCHIFKEKDNLWILNSAIKMMSDNGYANPDTVLDMALEMVGGNAEEIQSEKEEALLSLAQGKEMKTLAVSIFARLESFAAEPWDYFGGYRRSERAKEVYTFISGLGYKPAKEEREFINGTHEAYLRDDE